MAELAITIVSKLIEVIKSEDIKKICKCWGYKSQLEELIKTVSTIKSVLLDAEAKRDLSVREAGYIQELKDVVYDADDLFDELSTLAELNQLGSSNKVGKLFDRVRCFFSSKNQAGRAYKMSRRVKDIRKRLDVIASTHQNFGFNVDYKPIVRRREETCSYLYTGDNIIGRDDDKRAVIDMLVGHPEEEHVRFVTIVGVGGLGKTALAKLVFNDKDEVQKEFPDPNLRLWVCVSDQDGEQFDVKAILCKILELVSGHKPDETSSMESLQKKFQEKFRRKKFLLVLDDVWNENLIQWRELRDLLMVGHGGSRVVVTTRSEITANIVGDYSYKHTHKLQGLSPDYSWRLFEMTAFVNEQIKDSELVMIGKKIVEKCYNVPLAIKVVGSLLFGQPARKWRSFEEVGLNDLSNNKGDNEIVSILKLSYYNLESSLKSCFTYCALFPKDKRLYMEKLIGFWIAQGYIVPFHRGQSVEDAAEEHFSILLRRCFFQDIKKDEFGDVEWVKMHDLMHDVAQEVGKGEICELSSIINKLEDNIRHVACFGDNSCIESFVGERKRKIRSLVCVYEEEPHRGIQVDNWKCVRVLVLRGLGWKSLPDSIGELLHLRYLDLSESRLQTVCDSVTKLHNLETLYLVRCKKLREFPRDLSKLNKLRQLDLTYCDKLSSLPSGMNRLATLSLSKLEVGDDNLEDLIALCNVKDNIKIQFYEVWRNNVDDGEVGYLNRAKHLKKLKIKFDEETYAEFQENVMEKLEPHSNLRGFVLKNYVGSETIPRWGRAEDNWALSLPNLVEIEISWCRELKQLPSLSELPHLKSLTLSDLINLEYIENRSSNSEKGEEFTTLFPSLEDLRIYRLSSLKGWWRDYDRMLRNSCTFPSLSSLLVRDCHRLTSFFVCPNLEKLDLKNNGKLEIIGGNSQDDVRLREATIDDVGYINSIYLQCLTFLHIEYDDKVESLSEYGQIFRSCASSLRSLHIERCMNLRRLSGEGGGLETMANGELNLSSEDNGMPWKSLHQSLRSLNLRFLPKMTGLPEGMQYLTSLQTLSLSDCDNIKALPEWISCLSSLKSLTVEHCKAIKSLPESMRNLTSLQTLVTSANIKALPEWISCLSSLQSLTVRNCKAINSLPESMRNLTSLQTLSLVNCPNIKALPEWISCLSSLQSLTIDSCKAIKSLPESMRNLTSLQTLEILFCPELNDRCKQPNGEDWPKILHIRNVRIYDHHTQCLTSLSIVSDNKVESLSEYGQIFRNSASSLRSLDISCCHNLRRLSGEGGGLEHLTALEELRLANNVELNLLSEDNGMHWKSLHQSLRSLHLDLPKMTGLPEGMQYLTSLQTLSLSYIKALPEWISCLSSLKFLTLFNCEAIKSLPESMRNLTSLQKLKILDCPGLQERCKQPNGEDWPKILHIRKIHISDY